jgi:hypothetical protein
VAIAGTNLNNGGKIFGATTSALTISNDWGQCRIVFGHRATALEQPSAERARSCPRAGDYLAACQLRATGGRSANFTVAAIGNTPFAYQWRINGTNLSNGPNFSGATGSSLTINTVSSTNAGGYTVVLTNSIGSTTSAVAVLSITPVTAPGVALTTFSSFAGGNDGQYLFSPLAGEGGLLCTTVQGGKAAGARFSGPRMGASRFFVRFNKAPHRWRDGVGRDGSFYGINLRAAYAAARYSKPAEMERLTPIPLTATTGGIRGRVGAAGWSFTARARCGFGHARYLVSPGGAQTTLAAFNGANGAYLPALSRKRWQLYGTTENGGTNGGAGCFDHRAMNSRPCIHCGGE